MGLGSIVKKAVGAVAPSSIIGTAAGGLAAGGLDFLGQKSLQNDSQSYSAKEAAKSRDFQKWFARNQVQLRVADLKDAGINPILAASAGLGGVTVPGSSALSAGTNSASPGTSAIQALTSINQLKLLKAQIENIKAQTDKTNQEVTISEPLEWFRDWVMKGLGVAEDTTVPLLKRPQSTSSWRNSFNELMGWKPFAKPQPNDNQSHSAKQRARRDVLTNNLNSRKTNQNLRNYRLNPKSRKPRARRIR